jgi:dephospho-CoA kinase
MLRVALTGGIATGKSYVLGRFAARGVPTVDADALVHEALAAGSPTIPRIVARFGGAVLAPDGSVDRQAMAARVFEDTKARLDLEALLHPDVFRRIDEWFSSLQGTFPPDALATHDGHFAVADIPLLFETHHEGLFDRIVVTRCEPAQQIERVMKRSGLNETQARARLAAQWPIEEKARLAHYVIDTTGPFEETNAEIDRVFEALTEDAEL